VTNFAEAEGGDRIESLASADVDEEMSTTSYDNGECLRGWFRVVN